MLFLWLKFEDGGVVILGVVVGAWPHEEGVLLVAEGDLLGQEGLADEINVFEYLQKVIFPLVEEGYVLILENVLTQQQQ
jgi:hypothetical protein